jgi:membrane-bound ClpP family serine protease
MDDPIRLNKDMGEAGAAEGGLSALLHKQGTSVSELRPAGIAEIEGRRVDVVTRGEMIPAGVAVEVAEVEGNRVVVKRADRDEET